MEEKLGQANGKRKRASDEEKRSEGSSDSSSEDEDDEGELATEAVDSEIFGVLNAIRSKDPRVYDEKAVFYNSIDDAVDHERNNGAKEKPMFLRDYHRENLLKGALGEQEDGQAPKTYAQEQNDLKSSIVKQIHAAADEEALSDDGDDASDDGGFLVPKPGRKKAQSQTPSKVDVEAADKDPETFLSNFMASRAWVSSDQSRFLPLESDDEEEERRAEEFEQAYNLRYEDPNTANEKLISHARDITAQRSVRREDTNPRKKKRDVERERREAEKRQRTEEKARLRKLKIEEVEDKVKKIKQAAGLRGKKVHDDDWTQFIEENWDDDQWEAEMKKRFGDDYYQDEDAASNEDVSLSQSQRRRKTKKPKWDHDIDIQDLVPDFVEEEEPNISLSGEESDAKEQGMTGIEDSEQPTKKTKKRDHIQERNDKKREARKQRRTVEQLVDGQLELEPNLLPGSSRKRGLFQYRDTSPLSYGLSPRDILMAEDSQLNEYAGLKKLAAFRDAEKKRKDQKKLGKKARLRRWRKDTFGDEDGPRIDVLEPSQSSVAGGAEDVQPDSVEVPEGKKKRRRSKKSKNLADTI